MAGGREYFPLEQSKQSPRKSSKWLEGDFERWRWEAWVRNSARTCHTHTDTSIGCGTNSMVQQGQARLEEVEKRLHRCLGAGWWTRTLLRARGVFKCGGPGSEWCWGETGWTLCVWWPGWDNQWRRQAPTRPWRERLQESKAEPAAEQDSRLAGEAGFHSNWKLRYC